MANFIQVRKAIKKHPNSILEWLVYLGVAIPICLLWANFIAPERLLYGNLLFIAILLWQFMTAEDHETNMIDIRHLISFIVIMLYLAQDSLYDSVRIFSFWLILFEMFHTAMIMMDIGVSKYREHDKNSTNEAKKAGSIMNGSRMPLLPALSIAMWIYSILLIAASCVTDLEAYNMFCRSISSVSTDVIISLPGGISILLLFVVNKIFLKKLLRNSIYHNSDVQAINGFIAQADLLILATFAVFFQQAHFSMIIILLTISARLYKLCRIKRK